MSRGLVNVYLGRYERGWTEIGDLASETANGRSESMLEVGGVREPDTMERIIDELTGRTGGTYVASIAGIEPTSSAQEPYLAFDTYDEVQLLAPSGGPAASVVRSITATADDNAHPIWTLNCNNRILEGSRDVEVWLRRSLPGFVGGFTETANPATPASEALDLPTSAKEWRASKPSAAPELQSNQEQIGQAGHISLWLVTLDATEASDVTVELQVSGSTVASCTVAAGDLTNHEPVGAEAFAASDKLRAVVTDGPTDVALVATARWF